MYRRMVFALLLAFALGTWPLSPASAQQPTAPASSENLSTPPQTTIQDTPTPLVASGVGDYALASPKLFWFNYVPACPPRAAGGSPAADYTQYISRIATYGSATRNLYAQGENCDGGRIFSNLTADASYLYYIGSNGAATGLLRLSTDANPGATPELINALVGTRGEVVDGGDKTFYASNVYNNGYTSEIGYVLKSNNQRVVMRTEAGLAEAVAFDGSYLFYLNGGALRRLNPADSGFKQIDTGVRSFTAEGRRLLFCRINPFECLYSHTLYYGKGNKVYSFDSEDDSYGSGPVYTSSDTSATMVSMTSTSSFLGSGKLFLVEERTASCGGLFCSYTRNVIRTDKFSGGTTDILYFTAAGFPDVSHLTTDGTYLFWREGGALQRLLTIATALPNINMRIFAPSSIGNGIEVTQGIQGLDNSVLLIQNRRTFVRVYVKSDGAPVSGVTASLSGVALSPEAYLGSLSPVNPSGTTITVRGSPNRTDLNQSFLFELPWSWTTKGTIRLTANINPYRSQLEPNYGDNSVTTGNLLFRPSPKLSAEFYRLNYRVGSTNYQPRINKDVLQTYSWIMRAYPIGGAIGTNFKPRLWDVAGDTQLGSWVNRSSSDCDWVEDHQDDRALCASYYTNGWLKYYRDHGWVPNTTDFYYGMISDGAAFPRGQAIYSQTSVGPAGSGNWGWDFDGSYADWYAGHEIGHSLGRAHPNAGSDNPATKERENCGHSRSDPGFPYGNTSSAAAPIGPASGSIEGFDVGDPSFGIAKAVYPSSSWNDVMSYCNNQWISDYTYKAMYDYMITHPSSSVNALGAHPAVSGDFLSISGAISADGSSGSFSKVSRMSTVSSVPTQTPGGYSLKLLDASNGELASYGFTPTQDPESGTMGFGEIVNFAAGTRIIQLVKDGGSVLASVPVSANPPTVSNVALQNAPNPVSGVVLLTWSANDPDGDALTYDIFYSRDNGATFQPVTMNATNTSAQIDTASLGGSGTAILRVVASDGANTGEASSAPFTMANKAPQPYVLAPNDNLHVHYGQLVNFSGMAFDAQDGTVDESGLTWKDEGGNTLGTGALISLDSLPVGTNKITLSATNSVGESANTVVTVVVDDDLNLPGPSLTAGPGQVGWQINVGDGAQTADITIGNSGSGVVAWNATSDQPWLTLSAPSGTVAADGDPSTLTLTANPTGLAEGQPYTAHVTITKPADASAPEQQVVITVSLSIGDVFNSYEPAAVQPIPGTKNYLPLLGR